MIGLPVIVRMETNKKFNVRQPDKAKEEADKVIDTVLKHLNGLYRDAILYFDQLPATPVKEPAPVYQDYPRVSIFSRNSWPLWRFRSCHRESLIEKPQIYIIPAKLVKLTSRTHSSFWEGVSQRHTANKEFRGIPWQIFISCRKCMPPQSPNSSSFIYGLPTLSDSGFFQRKQSKHSTCHSSESWNPWLNSHIPPLWLGFASSAPESRYQWPLFLSTNDHLPDRRYQLTYKQFHRVIC